MNALCILGSATFSRSNADPRLGCRYAGAVPDVGYLDPHCHIQTNCRDIYNLQFILLVAARHDIHSLREWSMLFWNTLPGVSAHNHRIVLSFRRVCCYLRKIPQFFRKTPGKTTLVPNSIGLGCGHDDGEARHDKLVTTKCKVIVQCCSTIYTYINPQTKPRDQFHCFHSAPAGGFTSTVPFPTSSQLVLRVVPPLSW